MIFFNEIALLQPDIIAIKNTFLGQKHDARWIFNRTQSDSYLFLIGS
jgi:hypothetical protein